MKYWKVHWHHNFADEPVVIFSEIAPDGYEIRKIHEYRDGRLLRTDGTLESAEIGLGTVPVGDIASVSAQPEFAAVVISPTRFEQEWVRADPGSTT